jgi:hypothetical protein
MERLAKINIMEMTEEVVFPANRSLNNSVVVVGVVVVEFVVEMEVVALVATEVELVEAMLELVEASMAWAWMLVVDDWFDGGGGSCGALFEVDGEDEED